MIIPNFSTKNWRKLGDTEITEFKGRDFWSDEEWIRMKKLLDSALSFRKSIKGKPTEEQLIDIQINQSIIDFYKYRCFGMFSKK